MKPLKFEVPIGVLVAVLARGCGDDRSASVGEHVASRASAEVVALDGKLTANNGEEVQTAHFVSIDGDTPVVGVSEFGAFSGKAHVFIRINGAQGSAPGSVSGHSNSHSPSQFLVASSLRMLPIFEHPGHGPAVIEPSLIHRKAPRIPARGVMTFFHDAIEKRAAAGKLKKIFALTGEGPSIPIYEVVDAEKPTFLCYAGLTAPFSAAVLEELIGLGAETVMACGGAGSLDRTLSAGHLVLPTSAVRHEGTSYHYQTRGRTSHPHPKALQSLRRALEASGLPWIEGKTWTTDAPYRETPAMVRKRRREGCFTVEMEAAALFAVAKFRGIVFGQLLYAGDDVSGTAWDERGWKSLHDVRSGMIDLCLQSTRN